MFQKLFSGDSLLKLGTRLTLYLSLVIIIVLSGYGYLHIYTRRDILIRKMKVEVRSIGQALKISLEKISILREMEYVQELIDALGEDEKILGVLVYHKGKNLLFRSRSLNNEGVEPFVDMIKKSIEEDQLQEKFGSYKSNPVFLYIFPLKNKKKKNIGGGSTLSKHPFLGA